MTCVVAGTVEKTILCSLVRIILQNVKDPDLNELIGLFPPCGCAEPSIRLSGFSRTASFNFGMSALVPISDTSL
jgi:hypothetical protein